MPVQINQVEALRALGVDARTLNGNTPMLERDFIGRDLEPGHPHTRLLYVTPELCIGDRFRRRVKIVHKQEELARVVVDEAHCISEWGHDFRKDFKFLSWFRESFSDVPIMALTGTANPSVRQDVLSTLGMDRQPDNLRAFVMSAQRPNLHLEERFTRDIEECDRYDDFTRWLRGVYEKRAAPDHKMKLDAVGKRVTNVSGIIYRTSRNECEEVVRRLVLDGIGARPFHALLRNDEKKKTLARWIANEEGYDIIVATTAFGMGIDEEDVRFVTHWRMPKSFEGYYQEAGRAGRDGKASFCFLYYSREDRDRARSLVRRDMGGSGGPGPNVQARMQSLTKLVEYGEDTKRCRHASICEYFGQEETPSCDQACDWHKDPQGLMEGMMRGLADEDWVSTQREADAYDACCSD